MGYTKGQPTGRGDEARGATLPILLAFTLLLFARAKPRLLADSPNDIENQN